MRSSQSTVHHALTSCGEALNEAIARGQAAGGSNVTARVVGIMYATNNGNNGGAAARSAQYFYDKAEVSTASAL